MTNEELGIMTVETALRKMIELGEWARKQLDALSGNIQQDIRWENIFEHFLDQCPDLSPSSLISCLRYTKILKEKAESMGVTSPYAVTPVIAIKLCHEIANRYIAVPRMIRFYRRLWRKVGLDAVWPTTPVRIWHGHERYRRLTIDEVRKLVKSLQSNSPSLADLMIIGYSTGLRLSDAKELERDEISPAGDAIIIVPNKTRHVKTFPIFIPLIAQAQEVVIRRIQLHENGRWLFPELIGIKVSRIYNRAFQKCGVNKIGAGRASFHSLRATFISMMDEAGIPPYVTDAITGHVGGNMHARYTQPSIAALRSAVERAIVPL